MKYIFYIADKKMYRFDTETSKSSEIKSPVLEDYRVRVLENAKRHEWKSNGTGARFMNEGAPEVNPESAVQNIKANIHSLSYKNDRLIYSLSIDDICGIYLHRNDSKTDGILISDSNYKYTHFAEDPREERTVVCSEFAGEKHIGIIRSWQNQCDILTEGASRECWPTWSEKVSDRIIYSGCGLAISQEDENENEQMKSFPQMIMDQYHHNSYIEGPYSVFSLDLDTMELEELITDVFQKTSYIKPYESRDGYLYYIKRPYIIKGQKRSIRDIIMAPFRFLGAIGGFMNFFTMKYSGKTLTGGQAKAKQRSEAQMFIDGNLFDAEKEILANQKEGDKNPGVIPRSYELCRRHYGSNKEEVIKKGIIAYAVTPNGDILCSNGLHLLKLTQNEKGFDEELLLKEKAISFISI